MPPPVLCTGCRFRGPIKAPACLCFFLDVSCLAWYNLSRFPQSSLVVSREIRAIFIPSSPRVIDIRAVIRHRRYAWMLLSWFNIKSGTRCGRRGNHATVKPHEISLCNARSANPWITFCAPEIIYARISAVETRAPRRIRAASASSPINRVITIVSSAGISRVITRESRRGFRPLFYGTASVLSYIWVERGRGPRPRFRAIVPRSRRDVARRDPDRHDPRRGLARDLRVAESERSPLALKRFPCRSTRWERTRDARNIGDESAGFTMRAVTVCNHSP